MDLFFSYINKIDVNSEPFHLAVETVVFDKSQFSELYKYVVTNKQLKQMVKLCFISFPPLFTRFKLSTMTPARLNTYISK